MQQNAAVYGLSSAASISCSWTGIGIRNVWFFDLCGRSAL